MMQTVNVRSTEREQLIDITREVEKRLSTADSEEGICVLFVQHTTAALTVNENSDPDVHRDMLNALRTLIPHHGMDFRHQEGNSDAHIKASLIGPSITIPFHQGRLLLGQWQGIFLCEFDGPRAQEVVMMLR